VGLSPLIVGCVRRRLPRAAAVRLGLPADTIVEVDGTGPQAALIAAARAL